MPTQVELQKFPLGQEADHVHSSTLKPPVRTCHFYLSFNDCACRRGLCSERLAESEAERPPAAVPAGHSKGLPGLDAAESEAIASSADTEPGPAAGATRATGPTAIQPRKPAASQS